MTLAGDEEERNPQLTAGPKHLVKQADPLNP
jgi:hypothetical protein